MAFQVRSVPPGETHPGEHFLQGTQNTFTGKGMKSPDAQGASKMGLGDIHPVHGRLQGSLAVPVQFLQSGQHVGPQLLECRLTHFRKREGLFVHG